MKKKEYSSLEIEFIELSLNEDVLGASTNPPPFYEHGTEAGDDGFEGGL